MELAEASSAEDTDCQDVHAARKGDLKAAERLYRRHHLRVMFIA